MREGRGRRSLFKRHGRLFDDSCFRQLLRGFIHFSDRFVQGRRGIRSLTGAHLLTIARRHSGSTATTAATPAPRAFRGLRSVRSNRGRRRRFRRRRFGFDGRHYDRH
jgi:hypothetical protein